MSLTETVTIPLGFIAPAFELLNVKTGEMESFQDHRGSKATVVMFICNHCPFVVHVREKLVALANHFMPLGVGFIAISSNDIVTYPADSPELMRELAEQMNFPFPYFYDESQEVAKAYSAVCTPDIAVFNENDECVYRGRLDDSTPGNGKPVTGADLTKCLETLLRGGEISSAQYPSMGCNIKWKDN